MNCGGIIALVNLYKKNDFPDNIKDIILGFFVRFIEIVKKKEDIKEIINFIVHSILNESQFIYLKNFAVQLGLLFQRKILINDDDFKTKIFQFIIDSGCIPKLMELIR